MRLTKYLAAAAAICVAGTIAFAAGMWPTLPLLGGAAYCGGSLGVGPVQSGLTGFGAGVAGAGVTTGTTICGQTVPAGPAQFAGTEVFPTDIYAPGTAQIGGGASTALVSITQVGQGLITDDVTAGATVTIPNGTTFFVLDTGTSATVTVTMPAASFEGQMVEVICTGAGGATSLTISANTGQSLKGGPSAGACASGTVYKFRFSAVAQASGGIAANTWLRIQ